MVFFKTYKKYLMTSGIIWAACLVLFVLIYFLSLGPQNRAKKRLESELNQKKQKYEFAQNASKEETKIRLYEQIEDLSNKLDIFVIDYEESANLSFDISQIASDKKVSSLIVENDNKKTASAVSDSNNIFESYISVKFVGGFKQFAAFLNALERNKPVLFVKEFTISPANQNVSAYQVKLDVAAFVRKRQDTNNAAKSSERVFGTKI